MEQSKIREYARSLYDAHGDKAEAEVAHRAAECEKVGDESGAENWRAIRAAIREMRGPHES